MSNIENQIKLITDTMLESIPFIKEAVKEENTQKFLPIFISIVEGFQSIAPYIKNHQNEEAKELFKKLESGVIECTKYIEENDYKKILSYIQFSFEPSLRSLHSILFNKESNNSDINKQIVIGMFHGPYNPLNVYNLDRIKAEFEEAKRQNCRLVFFESTDVDIKKEKINARISIDTNDRELINLPDVIYNISPKLDWYQDATEKWLRTKVPFTTFPIEDKLNLPKKLLKYTNLGYLLIPFIYVDNLEKVFKFFKENKKGVFKRAAAARGENIFFVEQKSENRFVVEVNKKPILMDKNGFSNWVSKYLIPDYFILQKYKEFKTRSGNPFDFRSHMQKNENGEWIITRLYPRIGNKKGILSNISRGGYSQELKEFLYSEFSENETEKYFKKLHDISFEIIEAVDKIYNFSISEVGIDLAIDKDGNFYMHEVNPVPQSKYHEKERAVNMIGYAKYLAKNQLFLTNDFQKQPEFKDQFFYKDHRHLEIVDLPKDKITIGLLYESSFTTEKYLEACAIMAQYANSNFYAFKISDIDYELKVIKGRVFENFEWKEKVVRYPDIILDRLRMKDNSKYQLAYEEFYKIPFSHNLNLTDLNKFKMMQELSKIDNIKEYIIPFLDVVTEEKIYNFIEEHNSIIIKPIHVSFALGIIKITKQNNKYIWLEDEIKTEYSWTQIKRLLKEKNIYTNYIVQKYISSKSLKGNAIDLRIHMIKDYNDFSEWLIAKDYVRVSDSDFKINTHQFAQGRGFSGTTMPINRYIELNFPNNFKEIQTKVWNAASEISKAFDKINKNNVNEQALDIALSTNGEIYLLEVNANRPGVSGYEYEIARYLIPLLNKIIK